MDKNFIFFPSREIVLTPKALNLPYTDIHFKAADGTRLNGWFIEKEGAGGTLLWFHGNGGNIGDRVEHLRLFYDFLPLHLFIIDYRGYGQSEGSPSEAGTYQDAEAALAYIQSMGKEYSGKLFYYGQSLGAAIAVELALRTPPDGLILEAPFTSIRGMARAVYPFLPLGFLIQTEYDSLSKIGKVKTPLLILHGEGDEIVPLEQGKALFEAANRPKTFFPLPGVGHNDTFILGGEPYLRALSRFIHEILR